MNDRRHPLMALGVCLLASLALAAWVATAAQAAAEWSIDGKTMTELGISTAPLAGEMDTGKTFLLSSTTGKAKTKITVECTKLVLEKGLLLKGGEATAELLYSSCKTKLSEAESKVCKPTEPLTLPVRLLMILHGNRIHALEDLGGTVKFGGECALPTENKITGSVVYECPNGKEPGNNCEKEQVTHLLAAEESVAKHFKGQTEEGQVLPNDEAFFSNVPASWVDWIVLRLALAYEGHTWRGAV